MFGLIPFAAVPVTVKFRFEEEWWRKISEHEAINVSEDGLVILVDDVNGNRTGNYINPKKVSIVGYKIYI